MALPSHLLSHQPYHGNLCNWNLDINKSGLITGYEQWCGNISHITKMWAISRKGCALLLPLSLAFFQVSGVNSNTYARTTALSAGICSGAGLVASSWYLFEKSGLGTRRMRNKWIKASRSLETKESIDFWVFFTLPVSSLAWSIFFCVATLGLAMWTNTGDISSSDSGGKTDSSVSISAVFLTAIIAVQTIQVYRGMRFFSYQK